MTIIEHLYDKFQFGKFRGCTFAEVLQYNPDYIRWVVENVSGRICVFENTIIEELRIMFPHFLITQSFESMRCQRMNERAEMIDEEISISYLISEYGCNDYDQPTYEKYGGSYAQDEMGYSDDDIDTIFDGDPDAYWNID